MQIKIITSKPEKVEEALTFLHKELDKKGKGMANSSFRKENTNTFICTIEYALDNFLLDKLVLKNFRETLLKVDPQIRINKIKKGGFLNGIFRKHGNK